MSNINSPSPNHPTVQYFREPRYSSSQATPILSKPPAISDIPRHNIIEVTSSTSSKASSDITRSTLDPLSSPPPSARSESPEDDWNDTRSVPLGPRWHDYTYREGDAFYGASLRATTASSISIGTASSPRTTSKTALDVSLQSMSGAMSALKRNVVSALYKRPADSKTAGFEVVRPARVPQLQDHEERVTGNSPLRN